MARNSKSPNKPPRSFATEAEAADWFASPAGRRHAEQTLRRAIREGTVKVTNEKTPRTDPAVLEELLERARQSMTKAVSLRIPTSDIETAKRIAQKKGLGYQTVLKQAIREGLRHV
jgi:predicted DNA binding CopG/RHH family protein